MRYKKLTALCMALLLCIPVFSFTARASESSIPGLTAENDKYRLYLDTENLSVILEEKQSGQRLYSVCEDTESASNASWRGFMASGFALECFNDKTPTPERLDAYNGNPEITVQSVTGGFDATVAYKEKGIQFSLRLRLTSDGFSAQVPADSLWEADNVRISGLYLYPFFGASRRGEKEGYMLIPEGAGALIDLRDNHGKYKSPYTKRVYGQNLGTQRVSAGTNSKFKPKDPVEVIASFYGMAHTADGTAFLATVEEGQYNAEIMAYPNGVITDYNWIAARFIYREQYNMQTSRSTAILTTENEPYFRDITMRFHMLTGDKANYMGMAEAYRGAMAEKGLLAQQDTSFLTRLDFFGADAKPWLMTYSVVPVTTVGQMEDMLEDLASEGLTDLLAIYKGWQTGGLTRNYGSTGFTAERKLGGQNALVQAAKRMAERGNTFLLYQDLLLANTKRFYNTATDIAKGINQVLMEIYTFSYPFSTLYYMTPSRANTLATGFSQQFKNNPEIGVAVGSVTNTLFSYYTQGRVYSRGDAAEGFTAAVSRLDRPKKALEQPYDYFWGDMDYFLNMPLYTSNYNFVSQEIPFIPIVLKGLVPYFSEYVNFEANERQFFLKMVEYGAYPSFILTQDSPAVLRETNSSDIYSSEYSVYKQQILDYSDKLSRLYGYTQGTGITDHCRLSGEVVRITYANGLEVVVNYSRADFTYSDKVVRAQSYEVFP